MRAIEPFCLKVDGFASIGGQVGFSEGLGHRRVSVADAGDVLARSAVFECQGGFVDDLAGSL